MRTLLGILMALTVTTSVLAAGRTSSFSYEMFERPEVLRALGTALAGSSPAAKPAESDSEQSYWYRMAMSLGRDPRYRHKIAKALNARGGFLDRKINEQLLKKEWAIADIPNFDTVTPALMRGGEPNAKGWEKLRALGVKTVVNLRLEDNDEDAIVRKMGMTPVWLPIPDTSAPSAEQVKQLHELVDRAGAKVYVHCSAGIFRTGTMVGTYRIAHGMTFEQALAEAKAHKFDPEWLNADLEVAFLRAYSQPPAPAMPNRAGSPSAVGATGRRLHLAP